MKKKLEEITTEDRIAKLKERIRNIPNICSLKRENLMNVTIILEHYFNTPDGREDAIQGLNSYENIIKSYEKESKERISQIRETIKDVSNEANYFMNLIKGTKRNSKGGYYTQGAQ